MGFAARMHMKSLCITPLVRYPNLNSPIDSAEEAKEVRWYIGYAVQCYGHVNAKHPLLN